MNVVGGLGEVEYFWVFGFWVFGVLFCVPFGICPRRASMGMDFSSLIWYIGRNRICHVMATPSQATRLNAQSGLGDGGEVHEDEGTVREERGSTGADSSQFICNICLDVATEPIVTLCGHLFW